MLTSYRLDPAGNESSRFGIHPLRRGARGPDAECQNLEDFCFPGLAGASRSTSEHGLESGRTAQRPAIPHPRCAPIQRWCSDWSKAVLNVTGIAGQPTDYIPPGTWAERLGNVTDIGHPAGSMKKA